MKKLLIILAALVTLQAGAQIKQVTLQASGLTCAMCSNAINKALQKLPFAAHVQSNIKESSFSITLKNEADINFDAIQKAVEGAGFSVAKLLVRGDFNNVPVSNDSHVAWQGENLHFLGVQKQVLSGEQTFQIVDKKFVTEKVYKKYAANTRMDCVKTGMMASCCSKDAKASTGRIYHVTI
jgi:copper chaperone CopZ